MTNRHCPTSSTTRRLVVASLVLATLGSATVSVRGVRAAPAPTSGALDPEMPRKIVVFDELPPDLPVRLAQAGVTHARVFRTVDAVAIAGPPESYDTVATWPDVVATHDDVSLRTYMWVAAQDTNVDQVRFGVKPLNSPHTGEGVTVAVVDTGIDTTHPDLAGQVAKSYDFTTSAIFDPLAGDPTDPDTGHPLVRQPVELPEATDDGPHGTWLAGVVAGTGKAVVSSEDMRGVAPDATLVNLDVSNAPSLVPVSSLVAAFEWIVEHRDDPSFPGGIRVAVAGLGYPCDDGLTCATPVLRAVLGRAIDAGVLPVFPAGKAADGDVTWPARYAEILATKGACKSNDDWSDNGPLEWTGGPRSDPAVHLCDEHRVWGAYGGPTLDVSAPAVDVWVPNATAFRAMGSYPLWRAPAPGQGDPAAENSNRFWYVQALSHSLSAAHVAGIAALMLGAAPCLTPAAVQSIMEETARDVGPTGFDERSGHGMVDALSAVVAAERAAERCGA